MPCPCHLENRRKYPCAGRSAQLVLSVFLFIVALGLTKDAVARIDTSSDSLSFGSVTAGTSLTQGVTLTNTGFRPETVSQATVTGAGFSISGPVLPLTLNRFDNATFNVEFAPAVGGSVTGTLSIVTNTWWNSTISISLSGTGVAQPTANLSPPSMTFASQALGSTSSAQAATLTNSGGTTLNITSIALTGANASDFAQTNTCGGSVAGGANCTISVTFTPAASGSRTASVSITDNASGSPQTVSLSGTGTGTATLVSLSPTSLAFGNQSLGTTSAAQALTLSNTGNAALSITSLALTGSNASDFAQTNTCGSSVAAGANCTIAVMFTPSVTGTEAASLSIADNATASPQTVSLSGTGTAALVSLSPTSLAFGNQSVGTTSAAQTLTLSNTGSAALSITSLALTGTNASDFAQTNTCGSSVAASANCTISVTFTPAASGSRTASVSITDNASGSPQTVSLSGTGTGTAALVSLSPTSLAFGNQAVDMTSTAQTVTLSNTGNAALSITSLALTGTNASDFDESDTCGSSLAAGANCTIAVMFTPSVTGTEAASVSISDNASGSPQTVSLSGAGTHDVILSWTASTTPGVVGYNVYRGTTSGGPYPTELNSSPINGTTYTDATAQAGQTYYYVVTAVASDDVTQSADSNQVSATVLSP
ncbi:MAG: choice-of-anchor D domain-containing protein [Terriglobia bacterium]